jgi:hypothetical protein
MVITARLWTVLLLLAGLVAMHGWQCPAHSPAATPAEAPASAVAMGVPLAAGEHMAGAVAPGVPGPMVDDPAVVEPLGAAQADAGHDRTSHGAAGHLWMLCLAVLAAGMAVLFSVFAPRLVGIAVLALRRARARAGGRLNPPRPPDLSALCLLRI